MQASWTHLLGTCGQDGLTGVSHEYAAFPVAQHADMMAPGSRGGDIPLRGGCRSSGDNETGQRWEPCQGSPANRTSPD